MDVSEIGLLGFQVPTRRLQIVVTLKVHPKLRRVAEIEAQPKRGIGGDAPSVVDDLGDPVR
jgi:hypothetical protein